MIPRYVKTYKKIGETPLEALKRLSLEMPEIKDLSMTYAGRLDPLAEGELLVLLGEECKKKDEYLGLDKEYEFEMLFGFKTDSYDLLGVAEKFDFNKQDVLNNLEKEIISRIGKFSQKYPPFSSKTVGGVPLFQKTKNGEDYDAPEKDVEIYKAGFLGFKEIKGENLLSLIKEKMFLVSGDFRQEEIVKKWENILSGEEEKYFLIAKAIIHCSSGTYVRSFVNDLSFPATTFSINRTKIFGV
ncbi:MAG: tRNA pseudouridine55 synthase [Patescibacteria group bacterium]|jgi:tRNA pseudouridine(55) synthase|nr:tRNA pseudouridine55 synthase [Patescibacteria group bacterium]